MFRISITVLCTITLLRFSTSEFCNGPLGIEDGRVTSDQLTASTEYNENYQANHGRLNSEKSWVAKVRDEHQWIQVDLGDLFTVTGVITQGRATYDQWVTSYKILHSTDGDQFQTIMDASGEDAVFVGNSDRNTAVTNMFDSAVKTKFIRINPIGRHKTSRNYGLRFEVLGCLVESHVDQHYNHHCYMFVSNATTWNDAKAICESFSSQLITINSEEELTYFTTVASHFDPFPYPWTGMNDIAVEGHPVWLTHAQQTYNEFMDNNDDPENNDCFHININGSIQYASCENEFGYICERSSIIYRRYSKVERHKSPAAGYVVRSVLAVSSGACSLECGRLETCVSFSFISSSNECILSSSTGQSSELDDAQGADFYNVTTTEEICKPFT